MAVTKDELAANLKSVTWGELERRVQAGIRALHRDDPEWIDMFDLDRFNLRCHYSCSFGQTYGSFNQGLEHFEWEHEDAEHRGLFVCELSAADKDAQYAALDFIWREQITALQDA
ncbi:hypothetical protein GCM10009733_021120 [Nonomuraea maheshkhaliensis]|uniref:Uncharacterized protein n=1 Tax=Nonomuraea maheshkhaliensis TaxID=419590 RepID=A0ABN2EZW9_9ACTN